MNEQNVDLGTEINKRLALPHAFLPTRLTEERPGNGYFYLSALYLQELSELEESYQLYLKNPRRYWKLVGARLDWIEKVINK